MKARFMALAIGALLAALALAGCGGDDDGGAASGEQTTEESREEVDVGVTMIGPRNDMAFSQAHVEGAKRAQAEIPGVRLTRVLGNRMDRKGQIDALETLGGQDDLVVAGSSAFGPL